MAGFNPLTSTQAQAITQKNIAHLAMTEFNELPDYKQVMREDTIDGSFSKEFQRYQSIVGFWAMKKWGVAATASSDNFKMAPKKDLWAIQYGTQVAFERKLMKLQQYPVIGKVGQEG